jgi:Aspartyl protease
LIVGDTLIETSNPEASLLLSGRPAALRGPAGGDPRRHSQPFVIVRLTLAAALLLLTGCAHTDRALFGVGDCHLEKLGDTALEVNDGLDLVVVQVDGNPLRFVVDTGAETSLLSSSVAARLHLATDPEHGSRSWGIGGPIARFDVHTDNFVLAGLSLPIHHIAVGDISVGGIAGAPDGLLGTDVLRWFDLDIDPASHRLTLYRGEPCWLNAPPWSEPAVALAGVQGMGPRKRPPRALLVPITLNGITAPALLDTGSQASAVSLTLAEDAGASPTALASDRKITVGGAGPDTVVLPLHRFDTLQVGAWLAQDPVIPVLDLPQPGEQDPPPPHRPWKGIIGQDLLVRHRLWISVTGWQVFLSEPNVAK